MRGREYYSKVLVLRVDAHPMLSFSFQLSFTWALRKVIICEIKVDDSRLSSLS